MELILLKEKNRAEFLQLIRHDFALIGQNRQSYMGVGVKIKEKICGGIFFSIEETMLQIAYFYVLPNNRRKGIGSFCLEYLIQLAETIEEVYGIEIVYDWALGKELTLLLRMFGFQFQKLKSSKQIRATLEVI